MTHENDEPRDSADEAEIARRRDEVVKRMLATPPQPHSPKGGKKKGRPG